MLRPLEGKVVLVTGAGVRLGRAIAEELGRAGATVGVHFHSSQQGGDEVVALIRAGGSQASAFGADLTRGVEVAKLVERVETTLGPVSGLVNSAAVLSGAPFLTSSEELLDRQWAINARGPYLLTREVVRRMLPRGGGDVVNVLDVGGSLVPWANHSAYCMTKAALASLTRCLALELAPAVRVNAVAPGTVLPPAGTPPETLDRWRERIPQKRIGEAADVALAVKFLLSGPRYITGQILAVDGGRSLTALDLTA